MEIDRRLEILRLFSGSIGGIVVVVKRIER